MNEKQMKKIENLFKATWTLIMLVIISFGENTSVIVGLALIVAFAVFAWGGLK